MENTAEFSKYSRDELLVFFGRYQAMCGYVKNMKRANGGGGYCEVEICEAILGLGEEED